MDIWSLFGGGGGGGVEELVCESEGRRGGVQLGCGDCLYIMISMTLTDSNFYASASTNDKLV